VLKLEYHHCPPPMPIVIVEKWFPKVIRHFIKCPVSALYQMSCVGLIRSMMIMMILTRWQCSWCCCCCCYSSAAVYCFENCKETTIVHCRLKKWQL
jgi:hypothetical protein